MIETTAFGAAFLAGLSAGLWEDKTDILRLRQSEKIFTPKMSREEAAKLHAQWLRAVEKAEGWIPRD